MRAWICRALLLCFAAWGSILHAQAAPFASPGGCTASTASPAAMVQACTDVVARLRKQNVKCDQETVWLASLTNPRRPLEQQYDKLPESATATPDCEDGLPQSLSVALLDRSYAYRQAQQGDLALKDAQDAEVLTPRSPDVFLGEGQAFDLLNKPRRAVESYSTLIRLDPEAVQGWSGRCVARARMGKTRAAQSDCAHALSLAPLDVAALTGRGNTYLQQKKFSLALHDFQAALMVDRGLAEAQRGTDAARRGLEMAAAVR